VPFGPLGKGFLAGNIDDSTQFAPGDFRNILPRFTPQARKTNRELIDVVAKIAARLHATPAQLSLAWLLAQRPWIVPIPGTRKLERLEENVGAASIQLTPQDLREIDAAAARIAVEGARYPEMFEKLTGR
jgi:aryl-alcohol dehydrogenase-like predicted oxidoreductase